MKAIKKAKKWGHGRKRRRTIDEKEVNSKIQEIGQQTKGGGEGREASGWIEREGTKGEGRTQSLVRARDAPERHLVQPCPGALDDGEPALRDDVAVCGAHGHRPLRPARLRSDRRHV